MDYPAYQKYKFSLATKNRLVLENHKYHIVQRAPGDEPLFCEEADYVTFMKLMIWAIKKFEIILYAYALIPNHLHILCEIKQPNLSEAMQTLFRAYAMYFNKKYERIGHVFSGRFRSFVCLDDNYFYHVSRYIHLNPYRAGLASRPEDYVWTSLNAYLDPMRHSCVDPAPVLEMLDKDHLKASRLYREGIMAQAAVYDSLNAKKEHGFQRSVGRGCRRINGQAILERIRMLEQFGVSENEIMVQLNISRATYYRKLRELRNNDTGGSDRLVSISDESARAGNNDTK
jgi:putative transposase